MAKLEKRLRALNIWYRFVEKPESTVHTADAASVTGIAIDRISKNLMVKMGEDKYAALIIPGNRKVDLKAAAKVLQVKKISLVPFADADKISGYPPGGTPSVGHEKALDGVIVDEELMKCETFFCGGGSTLMLLELRRDDVLKVTKAKVASIAQKIS
jgi:Cys-tRNA(Pro)/Cys-tRNA(Cys) deacylase